MDLSKVMLGIIAFALGLCLGGCLPLPALFIGFCILFGAYYLGTAFFNAFGNFAQTLFDQQQKEQEEQRTIGYEQNLIDIDDDN